MIRPTATIYPLERPGEVLVRLLVPSYTVQILRKNGAENKTSDRCREAHLSDHLLRRTMPPHRLLYALSIFAADTIQYEP